MNVRRSLLVSAVASIVALSVTALPGLAAKPEAKKEEEKPPEVAEIPRNEKLLEEIRDILARRSA